MSFVRIEKFGKSYGDIRAVEDFSLSVNDGEIFALVGPDGAGKTTIMRALCNLILASQGSIHVGEFDVIHKFDQVKAMLGYMPQTFSLYPDLSVRENLRFYGGIFGVTGDLFEQRCERLYTFSNLKPFTSRRAQHLSGGMKQKLALSCALIHEPRLLVLDEPTTGVDPLSRQQFWEMLLSLRDQGITILVSTPYMDEVARSNRACFLYDGKKLAQGTPEELAAMFQGEVYYYKEPIAPEKIDDFSKIEGISARRFGSGVRVYLDGGRSLAEYSYALNKAGIDLEQLKPVKADLEDCFIQMMGGSNAA